MLNINHIAGPRSRMRVQMAVLHAGLPNEIEGAPFRAAEVKEMFVGAVIDRLVRDRRAAKQEEIRLGRVELQLELVRDLESLLLPLLVGERLLVFLQLFVRPFRGGSGRGGLGLRRITFFRFSVCLLGEILERISGGWRGGRTIMIFFGRVESMRTMMESDWGKLCYPC